GELEITFLKRYCSAGNLAALLKDCKLPGPLKQYTTRLQSLYEPEERRPRRTSNSKMITIENNVLKMLISQLNGQKDEVFQWMMPEDFCLLDRDEAVGFRPVQPRGIFHKQITHKDVSYSTFSGSQKDSFITFRCSETNQIGFGRIFSIFTHSRLSKNSENVSQTWLQVQCFTELPARLKKFDPFDQIDAPDVQICLRAWLPTKDCMVKLEEIVAHCAWMMYKPGVIHRQLDIPTVALVSTER
ncbi:hypothetical protein DFH28DRAFT_1196264, partial [Melampsora americana]